MYALDVIYCRSVVIILYMLNLIHGSEAVGMVTGQLADKPTR